MSILSADTVNHRFLSSAALLGLCAGLLGSAGVVSLGDRHGVGTALGGAGAALQGARNPAVYRPPLEQLEIVTAGYPRAFFFRTVVGRGVRSLDQAEFLAAFSQLNGVMGASRNFSDPTSLTRENEYLTALKEAYPQQMVSVMLSGQGRSPVGAPLEYAGHWLHFAYTNNNGDYVLSPPALGGSRGGLVLVHHPDGVELLGGNVDGGSRPLVAAQHYQAQDAGGEPCQMVPPAVGGSRGG